MVGFRSEATASKGNGLGYWLWEAIYLSHHALDGEISCKLGPINRLASTCQCCKHDKSAPIARFQKLSQAIFHTSKSMLCLHNVRMGEVLV